MGTKMVSALGVLLIVTAVGLSMECLLENKCDMWKVLECNIDDFRTCFNEGRLEPVDFSIESEEQLKKVCKDKHEAVKCAKMFMENCMEKGEIDFYYASVSGNMQVIKDLCEEGSEMNRDFIKNIGCFKKVRENVTFCNDKLKESQVALSTPDLLPRLKLFYQCCAFEWHRNCLAKMGRSCNEKAGDFMYDVVTMLGGPVKQQICSSYYSDCRGLHGVNQNEIDDSLSSGVGRILVHNLTITFLCLAVMYSEFICKILM